MQTEKVQVLEKLPEKLRKLVEYLQKKSANVDIMYVPATERTIERVEITIQSDVTVEVGRSSILFETDGFEFELYVGEDIDGFEITTTAKRVTGSSTHWYKAYAQFIVKRGGVDHVFIRFDVKECKICYIVEDRFLQVFIYPARR